MSDKYTNITFTGEDGIEQVIARIDLNTNVLEVRGTHYTNEMGQARGGEFIPLYYYNHPPSSEPSDFATATNFMRIFGTFQNSPGHSNGGALIDNPDALKAINNATNLKLYKDADTGFLKEGNSFVYESATGNFSYPHNNLERDDISDFSNPSIKHSGAKLIKAKESLLLIILMIILIIIVIAAILYFMNKEGIISIGFLNGNDEDDYFN